MYIKKEHNTLAVVVHLSYKQTLIYCMIHKLTNTLNNKQTNNNIQQ